MTALYGKDIAGRIRGGLKDEISQLTKTDRPPHLAVIIAGDDEASLYYAGLLKRAGGNDGFRVTVNHLSSTDTGGMTGIIGKLNSDPETDAVLVQLPLPRNIDRKAVVGSLSPEKDADGQSPVNLGCLASGQETIAPATARAVVKILKGNDIAIAGKEAVVIGRSTTVGLPAALLLLRENATVTACHTRTVNLKDHTARADIVVASAGTPGLIGPDYVKPGAAVVDVGTTQVGEDIKGDVLFEEVIGKASVSPVKGGVGAVTLACLLENTFELYRKNLQRKRA